MIPDIELPLKNADCDLHAEVPEVGLFRDLLELAVKDLDDPNPTRRKRARWWIFKDQSEELDSTAGYISFHAACEVVGIRPDQARKALEKSSRHNGQRDRHHRTSITGPGAACARRGARLHR